MASSLATIRRIQTDSTRLLTPGPLKKKVSLSPLVFRKKRLSGLLFYTVKPFQFNCKFAKIFEFKAHIALWPTALNKLFSKFAGVSSQNQRRLQYPQCHISGASEHH
jgi:hypothetical protein